MKAYPWFLGAFDIDLKKEDLVEILKKNGILKMNEAGFIYAYDDSVRDKDGEINHYSHWKACYISRTKNEIVHYDSLGLKLKPYE